jgi:Bacterial Ig-like domain (group 3)
MTASINSTRRRKCGTAGNSSRFFATFFDKLDRWLDATPPAAGRARMGRRGSQLQVELLEVREVLSQAFTPGSLVVERMGTGTGALGSTATAVFLDEYTTTGSFISNATVALPTTASGNNHILTDSGSASSEGLLTDSVDGHFLTLPGYNAPLGTTGVVSTSSATNPRVVGLVDNGGNVNTSTQLNAAYSGNNIRSAITIDDSNFWTGGATSGVQYVSLGSTGPSLSVSTNFTSVRSLGIFNNQLYTDSNTVNANPALALAGLGTVGTGLPTTGQAITELPGFPTANDSSGNAPSPYEFVFANSTTAYVADDRTDGFGGLQKWTFNGLAWSKAYNAQAGSGTDSGIRGLVGDFSGASPLLYGTTTATSSNRIVKFTDTGTGFTTTTLATAATNEGFRGIAFAPTAGTATTTSMSSNIDPANPGNPFTLSATVSPATGPTGTVTFYNNGVVLPNGVVQLQGGSTTATLPVNGLAAGNNAITAIYSGDPSYYASSAAGPSITSLNNTPFTAGSAGSFQVAATHATSYGVSGAPGWVTISNAGVLGGTPPAVAQATSFTFTITALDANGTPGSQSFKLYVVPGATAAVPFTPGDLLVYRVGSGGTTYGTQGSGGSASGVAANVYLDEYTPSGTFVQTVFMPTTGGNTTTASISGMSEGNMTLSADGRVVTFSGYSTTLGTASVSSTTSVAVPRVIGTVNSTGVVNTNTTLSSATLPSYSTATIRGVGSVNGQEFWTAGSAGGTLYVNTPGATQGGTQVSAAANTRTASVYDGTMYLSTGNSPGPGVFHEGASLPTSTTTADIKDVGNTAVGSPYQFAIVNLDGGSTLDSTSVMYVVDDGSGGGADVGGLYRFSYSGSVWSQTPTLVASNVTDVRSLTAAISGGDVVLYGTEATDSVNTLSTFSTSIVTLIDAGGAGSGESWQQLSTPVSYSDPSPGTVSSPVVQFRGITMVPQSPGISSPNLSLNSTPSGPNVLLSQPITLNAALNAQTGWVTFKDGNTTLATVPISSGTAQYTILANTLSLGSHTLSAFYGGDGTYSASTKSVNLTVVAIVTSTAVAGSPTQPHIGTNVTLTATITFSGNGTPTGAVTFTDNGVSLGTVSGFAQINPTTYTATLSVGTTATQSNGSLTPGLHGIQASYSGDINFAGSAGTTIQTVQANAFGSGDLLVYRTGDGTTPLTTTSGGNSVYVDEYTTAANQIGPVQSIIFPGLDNGTTHSLIADSQQANEGQLSLSGDGAYVFLTGYDAPVTTTSTLHTSAGTSIPRTIGTIKYDGTISSGVALSDLASGGSVRGIYSPDGNQFYATGTTGEVRYVSSYTPSAGSQTSTQIDNGVNGTAVSLDQVGVFGGQLYAASTTGATLKLGAVGTGVPTTSGASIVPLAGIPLGTLTVPNNPTSFYFTQLNQSSTGPDTLYIADDGTTLSNGTITKWALNNGTWGETDVITAAGQGVFGFQQMQGNTTGNTVTLYVTWGNSGNSNQGFGDLYSVTDTGGYNQPFSTHTVATLATLSSSSEENFRGVAFIPSLPIPATHFQVDAPSTVTAGNSFNLVVTAMDASNHATSDYNGTIQFSSNNPFASLPANVRLFGGVGVFSTTLNAAVNTTVTAADTVVGSLNGTSINIAVKPAAANHYLVKAPSAAATGTPFNFTVTVQDQFYNSVPGYTGTVHFLSTDASATLPANATLTSGSGAFSATLRTAGSQSLMAYDSVLNSVTGIGGPITVNFGATHFLISAPSASPAGNLFVVTVAALDQFNNTATGYTGTVNLTSTDSQAALPSPGVTLSGGIGTYAAILKTAGTQTLSATDAAVASITGSSAAITVTGIAANHFLVTPAALPSYPGVAAAYPTTPNAATSFATTGSALVFSVAAVDPFGNLASNYAGTVGFASSDTAAAGGLPANSALVAGVGTFSATLQTAGNQTITVTDTNNNSIAGASNAIATRGLVVTSFAATPSGFTITFDKPFNTSTINLYTQPPITLGDDVILATTGSQVSVRGSVLITSPTSLTFVKTNSIAATGTFNPAAGLLAAGNYTVTLRSLSGGNGFQDALGAALDGTDTGHPSNYGMTFSVGTPPVAVGIPDFARGPSNTDSIFLPALTNGSTFALSYTNPAANPTTGTATITFNTTAATLQASIQAALTSGGLATQVGANANANNTPNAVVVVTNDVSTGANVLVTFQSALAQATNQLLTSNTPGVSILVATINVANNIPGNGIPIAISSGLNVTSGSFTLQYNPSLLTVSNALVSKVSVGTFNLVSNTINNATSGTLVLSLSAPSRISSTATAVTLGSLLATVPLSATSSYGAKQLLHFSSEQLAGTAGPIPVTNADGVEVAAYFGNVSGTGGPLNLGDAGAIASVAGAIANTATQTIPGFTAFPNIDPVVVGDVSLQGSVNSTDAGAMTQEVGGTARVTIPYAPIGLVFTPGGPGAFLTAGGGQATPAGGVSIPALKTRTALLDAGNSTVQVNRTFSAELNGPSTSTVQDMAFLKATADQTAPQWTSDELLVALAQAPRSGLLAPNVEPLASTASETDKTDPFAGPVF